MYIPEPVNTDYVEGHGRRTTSYLQYQWRTEDNFIQFWL